MICIGLCSGLICTPLFIPSKKCWFPTATVSSLTQELLRNDDVSEFGNILKS